MRIRRTGATKILNSKSEYSRCKIPRLVAEDTEVETNLGDMEEGLEDEVFWEMETEIMNPREARRKARKEKVKDLLNWGQEEDSLTKDELDTVEALMGMLENKQVDKMMYKILREVVDNVVRKGQVMEMVRGMMQEVAQKVGEQEVDQQAELGKQVENEEEESQPVGLAKNGGEKKQGRRKKRSSDTIKRRQTTLAKYWGMVKRETKAVSEVREKGKGKNKDLELSEERAPEGDKQQHYSPPEPVESNDEEGREIGIGVEHYNLLTTEDCNEEWEEGSGGPNVNLELEREQDQDEESREMIHMLEESKERGEEDYYPLEREGSSREMGTNQFLEMRADQRSHRLIQRLVEEMTGKVVEQQEGKKNVRDMVEGLTQEVVRRTWVETLDWEQVEDKNKTLGENKLTRGKGVEPRESGTGAASKRGREDLSSNPNPKRQRMEGRKSKDTLRAEGRDGSTVVEEQMDMGTPEGAAYLRGRRWRTARRATGKMRETKGTVEKMINSVKLKEWTGIATSKRKRRW